jgi:hypothetical protein
MASPAQTAYLNTVPLPPMDPNADPNGILPTGAALSALNPSDPAAVQQPVGSAMDAMDGQEEEPLDDLAAQLAAGRRIRITSKEQWAAMSPHQKEVVRAAMSSGGQITSNNAVRIYQDSVKRARANQVQTVSLPDGRTVYFANGQRIEADKQPEPVKLEREKAEDGTIMMIDPLTGRSFPAWNEANGEAVRGQAKLSATQEDNIKRLQMQSENIGARLNALTNFTENDKVEYDNQTGNYVTTWGNKAPAWVPFTGKTVKEERAELEKEKSNYDKRIEISLRPVRRSNSEESQAAQPAAAPSPTPSATPALSPTPSASPSPTPRPNPMPTPSQNITKAQYDALAPGATFVWNGKTLTKK